jgi:IMP dehydrogenase
MQVVTEKRFRHLPVVSGGHLIGVVSSGDLTRRIVAEREGVIDTLYDYIYGTYPG